MPCVHLEKAVDPCAVGQKAARLSQVFYSLPVPAGFVVTSKTYSRHVADLPIHEALKDLDVTNFDSLMTCSASVRTLITSKPLEQRVLHSIADHSNRLNRHLAVRSSSLAEDTHELSFAGQYDSFLEVRNRLSDLEQYIKLCWSSLYSPRALSYRHHNKLPQENLSTAVLIQNMVRGVSGVLFTANPNNGAKELLVEFHPDGVVSGRTTPRSLTLESLADIRSYHELSEADQRMLYNYSTEMTKRFQCPLDIEWCLDKGALSVLQIRPLKVGQGVESAKISAIPILIGSAVGSGLDVGVAQKLTNPGDPFRDGSILVVKTTSPEWEPVMRRARGLVTDMGSQTSHASLVAREMKLPAVVGTMDATTVLSDGQIITLDTTQSRLGRVYGGEVRDET